MVGKQTNKQGDQPQKLYSIPHGGLYPLPSIFLSFLISTRLLFALLSSLLFKSCDDMVCLLSRPRSLSASLPIIIVMVARSTANLIVQYKSENIDLTFQRRLHGVLESRVVLGMTLKGPLPLDPPSREFSAVTPLRLVSLPQKARRFW